VAIQKLELETLADLNDGGVGIQFNRLLADAVIDCHKRAGNVSERVVTLQVKIKPERHEGDQAGGCDNASVSVEMHTSVPKRKTRKFQMAVGRDNTLRFNNLSPDRVAQGTLDAIADMGDPPASNQELDE